MSTVIRNEVSKRNPYHISKHRMLELKHFCLQYNEFIKERRDCLYGLEGRSNSEIKSNDISDTTANKATKICELDWKINLIRNTAKEADDELYRWLIKGVTEEKSYEYLQTVLDIPCCKDTYYDRYRRFFYLLAQKR